MHLTSLKVRNLRSIGEFDFALDSVEAPGWHVVLGANGAGKSSFIRAFAIAMIGPTNAIGLNQVWRDWQRQAGSPATVNATVVGDREDHSMPNVPLIAPFEVGLTLSPRDGSVDQLDLVPLPLPTQLDNPMWGKSENRGWFAASFGPYRRFTGGDVSYQTLFAASPRLAGHLSAFNEAVALTEGLRWLSTLKVLSTDPGGEQHGLLLDAIIKFLNDTDLLPGKARIEEVRSDRVMVRDANGALVGTDVLSDGYRSILSMIFELVRQLNIAFDTNLLMDALSNGNGTIDLPGVVAIDEVDAHLHPDWQAQIGGWFTRVFPKMQFIVTTHSPIVCRNARSIWWLPRPGTEGDAASRVTGIEFDRLTKGSIQDAYGTDLFGLGVSRSKDSRNMLTQLSELNRKSLGGELTAGEERLMEELRAALPTSSAALEA